MEIILQTVKGNSNSAFTLQAHELHYTHYSKCAISIFPFFSHIHRIYFSLYSLSKIVAKKNRPLSKIQLSLSGWGFTIFNEFYKISWIQSSEKLLNCFSYNVSLPFWMVYNNPQIEFDSIVLWISNCLNVNLLKNSTFYKKKKEMKQKQRVFFCGSNYLPT